MAIIIYGMIKEFNPESERISAYLERLQFISKPVNEVANAKKVSILHMVIGPKVYTLLRGLLASALPKEKSFKDSEKVLKEHLSP